VRDRRGGQDKLLPIQEALERGILKFYHPVNNFEFKYGQSCYTFSDNFLFLVNYVLDPSDKSRKIGLKSAFNKFVIDRENSVYFAKKGPPLALVDAIERGLISCEIVDLNLLETVLSTYYARAMQSQKTQPASSTFNDNYQEMEEPGVSIEPKTEIVQNEKKNSDQKSQSAASTM
jgi:hypothetical protein